MSKRSALDRLKLVLLPVFALGVLGCGHGGNQATINEKGGEIETVIVTAQPAVAREVQRTIEAVGTLHGFEEVGISAKVSGRVRRIAHDIGDRVEPGQVLLEIDPTDYELTARQVEKALQVELSKLGLKSPPTGEFDVLELPAVQQAKARLDNAEHHLNTTRDLMARKAVAQDELTDRQMAERVARADFDGQILMAQAGLATVQMRQEDLAIARQQLADTLVRAPVPTQRVPEGEDPKIDYAVTARRVAEGTYVPMGTELYRLVIDDWLKLRLPIPERYTEAIKEGQMVDVQVAAYDRNFEGQVVRINPAVDPVTRTFEVWVLVRNRDKQLKAGSFARAAIRTGIDKDAITVPIESVVTFAGVTKLFVIEEGKAREIQVVPATQGTTWTEIAGALVKPGALVVTSGQTVLADGTPVKLREKIAAANATPEAKEPGGTTGAKETSPAVNVSHEAADAVLPKSQPVGDKP
jgi:RND family efflux transporter MFP subunit